MNRKLILMIHKPVNRYRKFFLLAATNTSLEQFKRISNSQSNSFMTISVIFDFLDKKILPSMIYLFWCMRLSNVDEDSDC